jgi:hypothetical protein
MEVLVQMWTHPEGAVVSISTPLLTRRHHVDLLRTASATCRR